MKVAFIVMGYLPHDRGGVPLYIKNLRNELIKKNISSIVVAEKRFSYDRSMSEEGIYFITNPFYKFPRPFKLLGFLIALIFNLHIFINERPHLIHGHTSFYGGYQSILLSKIIRKPVVVTCHGIDDPGRLYPLYKYCNKIIFQITPTQKRFLTYRMNLSKLNEIPNCVKISENNFFAETKVFVFLARFDPVRNPILVLNTAKLAEEKDVEANFVLIGDGVLFEHVNQNKTLNMKLIGQIDDVPRTLRELSPMGYLALSDKVNFSSTSLLEMVNYNIPVIATDIGETFRVINNETGYLCDLTPESVLNRIIEIISDPKEAKRRANNAKKILIENFSYKKLLQLHLSCYRSIVE